MRLACSRWEIRRIDGSGKYSSTWMKPAFFFVGIRNEIEEKPDMTFLFLFRF